MNIENYSTVIIGAGMAGCKSAINLLENGHDDLLVIEAQSRIGGRINTIQIGNEHIELGAQCIHGQVDNPLFKYALENNLLEDGHEVIRPTHNDDFESLSEYEVEEFENLYTLPDVTNIEQDLFFCTNDGRQINSKIGEHLFMIAELVFSNLSKLKLSEDQMNSTDDRRLGDVLYEEFKLGIDEQFADLIESNGEEFKNKFLKVADQVFESRCNLEKLNISCSSLFDVSFKNYSSYKICDGYLYTEMKNGYKSLLDSIIEKYKEKFYSALRLNHFLKKIYVCRKNLEKNSLEKSFYQLTFPNGAPSFDPPDKCIHCKFTSDPKKVVLKVSNKDQDMVIICDRVLCTASLGFLKQNINNIFEPFNLLTNEKRLAISRVAFGGISKVYFFYDPKIEPFWGINRPFDINFCRLNGDQLETSRIDNLNNEAKPVNNWMDSVQCASSFFKRDDCLIFWVSGNEIENVPEPILAIELTKLLRGFLNNPNIPEPIKVIKTDWGQNPLFRGTYTYLPIGSFASDLKVLSTPLPSEQNPLVLFAGEHTHSNYYSTVHGAYLTGLRESNRILELEKNKKFKLN